MDVVGKEEQVSMSPALALQHRWEQMKTKTTATLLNTVSRNFLVGRVRKGYHQAQAYPYTRNCTGEVLSTASRRHLDDIWEKKWGSPESPDQRMHVQQKR